MKVWLYRFVKVFEDEGWFAKSSDLPIQPFPGMGIIIDEGQDPEEIRSVFLTKKGHVICEFEPTIYSEEDSGSDWGQEDNKSQFAYHTRGWVRIKGSCGIKIYDIGPPE